MVSAHFEHLPNTCKGKGIDKAQKYIGELKYLPVGHFDPQENLSNKYWNCCLIKSGDGTFCSLSNVETIVLLLWFPVIPQNEELPENFIV